jgi:hypothetical protein
VGGRHRCSDWTHRAGHDTWSVSLNGGPDRSSSGISPLPRIFAAVEPKTAEVVRSNRRGRSERVIEVVAERALDGFTCLEDMITPAQLAAMVGGYARLAGLAGAVDACSK